MKIRKRLPKEVAIALGLEVKEGNADGNAKYTLTKEQYDIVMNREKEVTAKEERPFVLSAWNDKGYMMDIDEYCSHYKLPKQDIKSYKLVSHTGTPFYNILFKENAEDLQEIDYSFIEEIVKKHVKPLGIISIQEMSSSSTFDRLVYTDTHIGMTPNENGYSLYGGEWDENVLSDRLATLTSFVAENCKSKTLIIDDLGDFMDGWDGFTTRGGHKLPQNMDNQKAFDTGVDFKVRMIDYLVNFYDNIIVNNICEDNHAGSFGYIVNSAFKSIIEQKYDNVDIYNHRKFINHYFVGSHCFLICHGKDSKSLKFGFKPHLDPKQSEKIDQYIKQNNIYKKSKFIEFSKGDSHQLLLDYCTSDDFDYCNYLAFSPSSEWVQSNFKLGRSGFVFNTISYKENLKSVKTYYFE